MKKARTHAGAGRHTYKSDDSNVSPTAEKSNTSKELARRDAAAMVHILNGIRSGLEAFEHIYESLKRLHGPPFEKAFRDELTRNREGKRGNR